MLTRCCSLLLLFFLLPSTHTKADNDWIEAGTAKARVSENILTIYPKTDDSFSKLRFRISHGHIILHQARIYLVKGDVINVNLQKRIKASNDGDEGQDYSRMIPLISSQQSPIEKVKVFYKFKQQQTPYKQVSVTLQGLPAS